MANGEDQQISTAFEALDPQRQAQLGGAEGFRQAVQGQRTSFPGLNVDVSIGNVLGGRPAPGPRPPAPQVQTAAPRPPSGIQTTDQFRTGIADQDQQITQAQERVSGDLERRLLATQQRATAPVEQPEPTEFEQLISEERVRRREAFPAQEAEIRRQGELTRMRQEQAGKRASGALRAALARTGALTATPEISAGVQASQARANVEAINQLTFQEQNLLQQARDAQAAGDFQLAGQQLQAAQQARSEIQNRQQQELQNLLAVSGEVRAVRGEERQAQAQQLAVQQQEREDLLFQLQTVPGAFQGLTPQDKTQFEQQAGLQQGFVDEFITATQQAQVAQTQQAQRESELNLLKVLKDIPQNVSIPLADGSIIRGLEAVDSNTQTFESTDPLTGNVTFTTIDKDSGLVVNSRTIEGIGKGINPIENQIKLLELAQLENSIFGVPGVDGAPTGFEILSPEDARSANKDVAKSEAFKGVNAAEGAASSLAQLEGLFKKFGNKRFGKDAVSMQSAYTGTLLELKELFNLGVLNGPDLELMQSILLDPTQKVGLFSKGGEAGIQAGIDQTKTILLERITDSYDELLTEFRSLNPAQVTNIENAKNTYDKIIKNNATFMVRQQIKADPNLAPQVLDLSKSLRELGVSERDIPFEVFQILRQSESQDFRSDLSRSVNGSTPQLEAQRARPGTLKKLTNAVTTLGRLGKGTITGIDGSSLWRHGLDFVLEGGRGARVPSPFSGTVTFVGDRGGFGRQIRIETEDGSEVWLSHLQDANVKKGQPIRQGQLIGKQGNTGNVLGGRGEKLSKAQVAQGRGTHLDLTIVKPRGGFYTAREVAAILGDRRIA